MTRENFDCDVDRHPWVVVGGGNALRKNEKLVEEYKSRWVKQLSDRGEADERRGKEVIEREDEKRKKQRI